MITPSRKLEVVDSPHSKRLIPNAVGFSETREYGENAISVLSKDPASVITFNQRAVGSGFNATSRLIEEYSVNEYLINHRGGISYRYKATQLTSEYILSMQLEFIKTLADKGTHLKDCVITIPSFYTQSQRKTLVSLAKAVNFNVLALIHDNTAAGLYYGAERFDVKPIYVIVYNIGASYIQTSLVTYSLAKSNLSKLSDKKNENIQVIGHSWNDKIGGRTIDTYIADYLATKFNETHGVDPRTSIKSKTRLIQEANRIKKTLSANKSTLSSLPSLFDQIDFEVKVERSLIEDYININKDQFLFPIKNLLDSSNLSISDINYIELIGGVSRIPALQKIISDEYKEISTHLNGDESIANGAALYAANFSSEVQIRQIWLNDYFPFSVRASIKSLTTNFTRIKEVFPAKTHLNTIKKISFNSTEDLEIVLLCKYSDEYAEITKFTVTDIELYSKKYAQTPNVVLSFKVDRSGIVQLLEAEARVEVKVKVKVEDREDKDDNKTKNTNNTDSSQDTSDENSSNTTQNNSSAHPDPLAQEEPSDSTEKSNAEAETAGKNNAEAETAGKNNKETETTDKNDPEAETTAKNETETGSKNDTSPETGEKAQNETNSKPSKKRYIIKTKQEKLKLSVLDTQLESPHVVSEDEINGIKRSLESFASHENELKQRIELKNDLESYIYEIKEKLQGPEFLRVLSPTDKELLESLLASLASWLETVNTKTTESAAFTEHKKSLQGIFEPTLRKEKELIAREDAVSNAFIKLESLYTDMLYYNKTKTWIPIESKALVFNFINDTQTWLENKVQEQKNIQEWELPVLKLTTLEAKVLSAERKVDIIKHTPRPKKEEL